MKLLKFRIFNYKSIADSGDCDISNDQISILAGQNESGKTNILEALRDFDIDKTISKDAKPDGKDDANPEIVCVFSIEKSDFDAIENDDEDEESKVEIPKELKAEILKNKKITIIKSFPSNEYSLENSIINFWKKILPKLFELKEENGKSIEQTKDGLVKEFQNNLAAKIMKFTPYFVYFEGFFDRLPKKKYVKQIGNTNEIGYQAVKDFIKLANIEVNYLENENDDKHIDNYLGRRSANITGDFLHYWTQKVDGSSQVKIITERKHDQDGSYLNFFIEDGDSKKYPEQRSKGFLWFLSFYLRLYAESLDKEDIGAIILIDEPGSYLHSKAQADVLTVLEKKIAKKHQVIFSTHSSDLIDTKKLNRVKLVLNKKGIGTKITKITSRDQGDKDFADALSPVIAAIGKDLGQGYDLVAKENVLLEGISDFYYLETLRNKKYFKIGHNIKLIPLSGVLKIEYMASLMLGWGLKFVIVMDRDGNSLKEYKILINELSIPKNQIFQVCGGKAIEDMFSQNDFKKFVLNNQNENILNGVANSDYINKNLKVILSQNFYKTYNQSRLMLEQDSIKRFKMIFDFIKCFFN